MKDAENRIIQWLILRQKEEQKDTSVEILADTDLLENGLLDSLDFMQLLTFIEEEYDLEIPVDLLTPDNFSTPSIAGKLVEQISAGT